MLQIFESELMLFMDGQFHVFSLRLMPVRKMLLLSLSNGTVN